MPLVYLTDKENIVDSSSMCAKIINYPCGKQTIGTSLVNVSGDYVHVFYYGYAKDMRRHES